MAQLPLIRFTSGNGIKNHFSHSRHDPEPSAQDVISAGKRPERSHLPLPNQQSPLPHAPRA